MEYGVHQRLLDAMSPSEFIRCGDGMEERRLKLNREMIPSLTNDPMGTSSSFAEWLP